MRENTKYVGKVFRHRDGDFYGMGTAFKFVVVDSGGRVWMTNNEHGLEREEIFTEPNDALIDSYLEKGWWIDA